MLLAVVLLGRLATPAVGAEGPPAPGEVDAKSAAQRHLDRGNDFFTHDRYTEALAEFGEAFALFPSPKLHFNLGQCERALGHDEAARDHFARFLAETPDVSAALRAEAQRYLVELDQAGVDRTPPPPLSRPALAAPAPVTAPAVMPVSSTATRQPSPPDRPLLKRWWFWAALGAVAAGVTVSAILLTREPDCPAQRCF